MAADPRFSEIVEMARGQPGVEEWGEYAVCYWRQDRARAVIHRGAPGKMVLTDPGGTQESVRFLLVRPIRGVVIIGGQQRRRGMTFADGVAGLFGQSWTVWNSLRDARSMCRCMLASALYPSMPPRSIAGVVRSLEPSIENASKRQRQR